MTKKAPHPKSKRIADPVRHFEKIDMTDPNRARAMIDSGFLKSLSGSDREQLVKRVTLHALIWEAFAAKIVQHDKKREQQGLPPLAGNAPVGEILGAEWIKRLVEGLYLSQEMEGRA